MRKKRVFYVLIQACVGLLVTTACGPSPEEVATMTAMAWTATPSPTSTSTSTPTQTLTPTASPTPLVVSVDGGRSATLTIVNELERNILVYWVDFEGSEQLVRRLKPGQRYRQSTYVHHAWRIRDEASKLIIKDVRVNGRSKEVHIVPDDELDLGPTLIPTITPTPAIVETRDGCVIGAPPDRLKLHPFYEKHCDAAGIPIISAGEVRDLALQQAWYVVMNMLAPRPDVREEMVNRGVKFAIFGWNEDVTNLPNFSTVDPGAFAVAKGSYNYPIATNNEGNMLCWPGRDYFEGNFVAVHEFAHAIHMHGLIWIEADFNEKLERLYDEAIRTGKWLDAYASVNFYEYWAEGVTFYFNAHPENYTYHYVNTRPELQEHDPDLYELIDEMFRGFEWTPTCP